MPPLSSIACTHDLGPGTTVCLRCRQEQWRRDRARQLRLCIRIGAAAVALTAASAIGAEGLSAWRTMSHDGAAHSEAETSEEKTAVTKVAVAEPLVTQTATTVTQQGEAKEPATVPVAARADAPLVSVLSQGRTELRDSLFAERRGDSVIVDFDTQLGRTRRRDKFERLVRETLPAVYGARADSLLAGVPEGGLVDGDLLTELPARGLRVALADGWALRVWPETRPGRDGPLVVRYRTVVAKD